MSVPKRVPQHAVHLRTYQELHQYAAAFAQGHLNLLIIFGPPGVGKTRAFQQALAGPVCCPLGIYLLAFQHRRQPIVLDDVDGLYADRNGIRLLKALCQTEKSKTLCWQRRPRFWMARTSHAGSPPRVGSPDRQRLAYAQRRRGGARRPRSRAGVYTDRPGSVSQIMSLLLLAPDIQEDLLFLPAFQTRRAPILLAHLQSITAIPDWASQRRRWRALQRGLRARG